MRNIPKKNYFMVLCMALVVVVLVLVLMNVYNANKQDVYDSRVKEVVNVLKVDDIDNYLLEHLDSVLYVSDSTNIDHKLDKQVRELITDNNLQQYFAYIEKTDEVVKKYKLDDNNPIFIAYKDGEVSEIYSSKEYSIVEIESFLIRNEVLDSD